MMEERSDSFVIDGTQVGRSGSVYLIAEAGVAHFGSVDKALELVDMAADAHADAVKFQIFKTTELISSRCGEWRQRMHPKELPHAAFRDIQRHCKTRGITFLATAHDEPSLDFLATLAPPAYKIGSGEVANWPFLRRVGALGKPVILSTGMYSLQQVGEALTALAQGGTRDIAVLHCVTQYPTPPGDVNLKAMDAMRERYGVITGYSDHTAGMHVPLGAVGRGAAVIEKHISLDFDIPDAQDWRVSLDGPGLRLFVQQAREIAAALGEGDKRPTLEESERAVWARKSLVAAAAIECGEIITAQKLCAKRPGDGISPSVIDEIIGKKTTVRIECDAPITWEALSP